MKFIKIYDDVFSHEFCDKVIETFEWSKGKNLIVPRRKSNGASDDRMEMLPMEVSTEFFTGINNSVMRYIDDLSIGTPPKCILGLSGELF
jgi:hypothetical protein